WVQTHFFFSNPGICKTIYNGLTYRISCKDCFLRWESIHIWVSGKNFLRFSAEDPVCNPCMGILFLYEDGYSKTGGRKQSRSAGKATGTHSEIRSEIFQYPTGSEYA